MTKKKCKKKRISRKAYLERSSARRKQVVKLYLDRNKNLTFREVGAMLKPWCSGQNAGEIFLKIKRDIGKFAATGLSYEDIGKQTHPKLTAAQVKQIHTEVKVGRDRWPEKGE